jgi:hypothetical protein
MRDDTLVGLRMATLVLAVAGLVWMHGLEPPMTDAGTPSHGSHQSNEHLPLAHGIAATCAFVLLLGGRHGYRAAPDRVVPLRPASQMVWQHDAPRSSGRALLQRHCVTRV